MFGGKRRGGVTNVYTAPTTIKRRLEDGRQVIVAIEGSQMDLTEAHRQGLIDDEGKITDFGEGKSDRPEWSEDESMKFSTAVATKGRVMDPKTGLPADQDMSAYGDSASRLMSRQNEQLAKLRAASGKPTSRKTEPDKTPPPNDKDKNPKK
jgi:phage gp45-like